MEPMVLIANAVNSMGGLLKKEDIVITGSMIPPIEVKAGVTASLNMDLLGSITLEVE